MNIEEEQKSGMIVITIEDRDSNDDISCFCFDDDVWIKRIEDFFILTFFSHSRLKRGRRKPENVWWTRLSVCRNDVTPGTRYWKSFSKLCLVSQYSRYTYVLYDDDVCTDILHTYYIIST